MIPNGYNMLYSTKVENLYGLKVKAINGRDPVTVLTEFAETSGYSYDKQTRFNQILKSDWSIQLFYSRGFPDAAFTVYTLVDATGAEQTFTAYWTFVSLADVSDTNLFKLYCGLGTSSDSILGSTTASNDVQNILFGPSVPEELTSMMNSPFKSFYKNDIQKKFYELIHGTSTYSYWNAIRGNTELYNSKLLNQLADNSIPVPTKRQSSDLITIISTPEFSIVVYKLKTIVLTVKTFMFTNPSYFTDTVTSKFTEIY